MKTIALATLLFALPAGGLVGAGQTASETSGPLTPNDDANTANVPYVIFSSLDPSPNDRYNTFFVGVAGKDAVDQPETSNAVLFSPKVDVWAKELLAALEYDSGTELVNLGIYSNNADTGSVGTLLPGGQGSITQLPDFGTCCDLATVTLAGEGVLLTAGTKYWLVASPDDVNGSTFSGVWRLSNRAIDAQLVAGFPWGINPGQWPAAEIRGTRVQSLASAKPVKSNDPESGNARAGKVTIFTNLDSSSGFLYDFSQGIPVRGNEVPPEPEVSSALPFTPRANVHAITLGAAVGYVSGTKKVNLGIYADNAGVPGAVLPGGQASTTDIPTFGVCCALARVTLPGAGVALTKGTQYWLVASPDDIGAPDFNGVWSPSFLALDAYDEPEDFIPWTDASGDWLAARIEGTAP